MIPARDGIARPVAMVGTFPPPVHGMAVVNAAMLERLRAAGVEPMVINTAALNLDRGLRSRLARLPRVVGGLVRLLFARGLRGASLYIGVSGGFGQIYDVAFLAAARLRGMRRFVHHHNYAYLDRVRWFTRLLIAVAGGAATHVVLCEGMARDLRNQYPKAGRTVALSNVWLLAGAQGRTAPARSTLRTIGFLSNISAEKGVFTFLDTVAALNVQGLGMSAKLAGPFQDAETERRVRERLTGLPNVQYVGPRYGADKERFFASIDALLFPTENESEGIVNHEALAHGVPVVANGRGCIPCVLEDGAGLVVGPPADFVTAAAEQVRIWRAQPQVFEAASAAARARFEALQGAAQQTLQQLVQELLGADHK